MPFSVTSMILNARSGFLNLLPTQLNNSVYSDWLFPFFWCCIPCEIRCFAFFFQAGCKEA